MKRRDIDGYLLSASGLNSDKDCGYLWGYSYLHDIKKVAPARTFKMRNGKNIHSKEEETWNCIREKPDLMLPLSILKSITREELAERLTGYKEFFCTEHEKAYNLPYLYNISYIDAGVFINLRNHFDGDVSQARKYLIPLEMELQQKNYDLCTNIIIDNLSVIPRRYMGYKNKKDSLIIKDYKPGNPDKLLSKNSDYGVYFQRQLVFYLVNLEYIHIDFPDVKPGYVAGIYYKTGQYVVDRITGHSTSPMEKGIGEFWDTETLYRRKNFPPKKEDRCNWCNYRMICRKTLKSMKIGYVGEPMIIKKYCKKKVCDVCKQEFYILKRKADRTTCTECSRVMEENVDEKIEAHLEMIKDLKDMNDLKNIFDQL